MSRRRRKRPQAPLRSKCLLIGRRCAGASACVSARISRRCGASARVRWRYRSSAGRTVKPVSSRETSITYEAPPPVNSLYPPAIMWKRPVAVP